jgi:DNA/RNA endonuclease G (NUC1)
MRKLITLLLLAPLTLFAQTENKIPNWDTIISTKAYVSFHSQKAESPVAVVYKLYKGGGPCDRAGFTFKNDLKIVTATTADYTRSGYDKGHMANSEDFASNCELDELTFRYYNCAPQTPELNRGPWRILESKIRDLSAKDSILVFCINIYGDPKHCMGTSKAVIPTYCIKVAKSMTTGKYLYISKFSNTNNPQVVEITDPNILKKEDGIDLAVLEATFRKRRK